MPKAQAFRVSQISSVHASIKWWTAKQTTLPNTGISVVAG
jgi:hypothetical protein